MGCSNPLLKCLNDISQTGSIPKEHKNPSSKPLSRFWDEKQVCSYNCTLNTSGRKEYLPKKTGIWIWGIYWRQGGVRWDEHGCYDYYVLFCLCPRMRPSLGGTQRMTGHLQCSSCTMNQSLLPPMVASQYVSVSFPFPLSNVYRWLQPRKWELGSITSLSCPEGHPGTSLFLPLLVTDSSLVGASWESQRVPVMDLLTVGPDIYEVQL